MRRMMEKSKERINRMIDETFDRIEDKINRLEKVLYYECDVIIKDKSKASIEIPKEMKRSILDVKKEDKGRKLPKDISLHEETYERRREKKRDHR